MNRPQRLLSVLAGLALAMSACSSGSSPDSGLADSVRAQAQAQEALRERVSEIEDQIASVLSRDDLTDFRTMEEALAAMQERVDELSTTVEEASVSNEDRVATIEATLEALSSDLQGLSALVTELRNDLQRLQEDQDALELQFQNHRSDDDRHQ